MMKDIEIKISRETRMVDLSKTTIGNDGENLQGNLVFSFTDDFVKGQGRLEYIINGESKYAFLLNGDDNYYIPIKSVMTKEGQIDMQLVITEGTDASEIPIFKSNVFYVSCKKSINAEVKEEEGYYSWIEIANTKLNEVDEAIEELASKSNYAKEQGDYAKSVGEQLIEDKNNGLFTGDKGDKGDTGATGDSGVYVGEEEPTNDATVWIDTDESYDLIDNESVVDISIPKQMVEGELVHITDALPLPTFENKISGNVKQEGEPSPTSPQEIEVIEGDLSYKVTGKNLFNKESSNIIVGKYLNENGGQVSDSQLSISDYMKVQPNKEYSFQPFQNLGAKACFYDKNKKFLSSIGMYSVNPNLTTPNNCAYIRISFNKLYIDSTQVELGDKATEYEPYQEQIVPLELKGHWVGAINDTIKDYLVTDKKKYWLDKNLYREILNGEDNPNISYVSYDSTKKRIQLKFKNGIKVDEDSADFLCSHYRPTLDFGAVYTCVRYGDVYYFYVDDTINSVSDWNEKLKVSPMTMIYQTNETKREELGTLEEPIKTFEGVNNIQLLANLDTNLQTTYALDIKKYVDNKIASLSSQIL